MRRDRNIPEAALDFAIGEVAIEINPNAVLAKPLGTYYLQNRGSSILKSKAPVIAKLKLPAGDYVIEGYTRLTNDGTEPVNFYCGLFFELGGTDASAYEFGRLPSTNGTLTHGIALKAAHSSEEPSEVEFYLVANAEKGFLAEDIRMFAFRQDSMAVTVS